MNLLLWTSEVKPEHDALLERIKELGQWRTVVPVEESTGRTLDQASSSWPCKITPSATGHRPSNR